MEIVKTHVLQLYVPSGELTVCNGKSPFLMGKSTISMAIFNCYVSSPEGICICMLFWVFSSLLSFESAF